MLRLLSLTTTFFLLFLSSTIMMVTPSKFSTTEALSWAEVTATRLVACYYNESFGLWMNELAWQSGNTLETLANFVSLLDSPLKYVFHQTYIKTGMFVGGDCYDDYQWWLLGWMQAYSVDPNINYLYRAADIYDIISSKAWNTTTCGGGIQWCPTNSYKNAISNELFLLSSMRLHPYTTLLQKPSTYYLDWALKEWQWFENSGMINSDYMINDGLRSPEQSHRRDCWRDMDSLTDDTCANNNQTTWTYNQGVILSGLALLYNATRNSTLINIAQKIADAVIQRLTYSDGILKEPCEPTCNNDQKLFKGIFVRHLGYLIFYLTDTFHIQKYTSFLLQNAVSAWNTNRCELDGLFGLIWNSESSSSCQPSRDTATTSAGLDLFLAVAGIKQQAAASLSNWILLGLGNCIDDGNLTMPNFYRNGVNETVCRTTANEDTGAVAYDYQLNCGGNGFCRIRTLTDRHQTPPGWTYENGIARNVTRSNKLALTNCFFKIKLF